MKGEGESVPGRRASNVGRPGGRRDPDLNWVVRSNKGKGRAGRRQLMQVLSALLWRVSVLFYVQQESMRGLEAGE